MKSKKAWQKLSLSILCVPFAVTKEFFGTLNMPEFFAKRP